VKNARSLDLLRRVSERVAARGWRVENVDSTVCGEAAAGAAHGDHAAEIAEAIGIGIDGVSVKATTTEKMGAVGREEACGHGGRDRGRRDEE